MITEFTLKRYWRELMDMRETERKNVASLKHIRLN